MPQLVNAQKRSLVAASLLVTLLLPAMASAGSPSPSDLAEQCFGEVEGVVWMDFDDFGPPSMSGTLLGSAWWQWDGEGHAFTEELGIVLVAVHNATGEELEGLEGRLQPIPQERCDVRLVSEGMVLTYFEEHIAQLEDEIGEPWAVRLAKKLRSTREWLLQRLQSANTGTEHER